MVSYVKIQSHPSFNSVCQILYAFNSGCRIRFENFKIVLHHLVDDCVDRSFEPSLDRQHIEFLLFHGIYDVVA